MAPMRALPTVAVLAVVCVGLAALAGFDHPRFEALAQEDAAIEWATVAGWAIAAAAFAFGARRAAGPTPASLWLARAACASVALFCVFCAGEEISWGQRLFAFQPPEMFLAENYQQELNVHNLLMDDTLFGVELTSKHLVALIAVVYGVLVAIAARLALGRNDVVDAALTVAPPVALAPFFAGVALVELSYPVDLTGEAAELVLALLFACAGVDRLRLASPRAPAFAVIGALVGGAVVSFIVGRVLFGSDEEGTAKARAELAALAVDLRIPGVVQPRLHTKNVHRRMYTSVKVGYLVFPPRSAFLDDASPRKVYFLDPWNNPYWLFHDKKTGRTTLYSFGPNRMRDSRPKKSGEPKGDDVMVTLTLRPGDAGGVDDDDGP